jgi:hypothetical protein
MDMLGYSWTRIEFRVQQIGVVIAMAAFPLTMLGLQVVSSPTMAWLLLLAATALTIVPHVQTAVALLHAATAAETSSETWDDVLESERVELAPQASLPQRPEPPAIKLE